MNKILSLLMLSILTILPIKFADAQQLNDSEVLINQLTTNQEQARIAYDKLFNFEHLEALKNHLSDEHVSQFDPYSQMDVVFSKDRRPTSVGETCRIIISVILEGNQPKGVRYFAYKDKEETLSFLQTHSYDSLSSLQLEVAKYVLNKGEEKHFGDDYINFWKQRIKDLETKNKN